jgi:hypothetical protein
VGDPLALLRGLLTGGAVALLVAMAGRRWGAVAARIAGVVAVVGGAVAGLAVVPALPRWPPTAAVDRLLLVALPLVAAVELVAALAGPRRPATGWLGTGWIVTGWLVTAARGLVALALAPVLLHGSVHVGPGGSRGFWEAISGAVLLACAGAIVTAGRPCAGGGDVPPEDGRSSDADGVELVALVMAVTSAGVVIPMAGYVKGGVVALVLAAALAGSVAGGARQGLGGMGLALLLGIVGLGRLFGGLSAPAALLLCLAPLGAIAARGAAERVGASPGGRVLRSAGYRLVVAALPLGVVLLHAWREFERSFKPLLP